MIHLQTKASIGIVLLCSVVGASTTANTLETRIQANPDNGPYTYRYCDTNRPECAVPCKGDTHLTLVPADNTADLFPDLELTMTETDIQRYKFLRQEYLVAFKKEPLPFESSLDLPFCGVDESGATRREVSRRRGISWGTIKEKVTAAFQSKRPEKPTCVPKTIQVNMHFHVFAGNFSTDANVTDAVIGTQFNMLNDAFAPLGISF